MIVRVLRIREIVCGDAATVLKSSAKDERAFYPHNTRNPLSGFSKQLKYMHRKNFIIKNVNRRCFNAKDISELNIKPVCQYNYWITNHRYFVFHLNFALRVRFTMQEYNRWKSKQFLIVSNRLKEAFRV